jgi:FAD/FMN-containing dehydrogenase
MNTELQCASYRRGEAGYEQARRGEMWNARLPARYPDIVVEARSDADVIAAVRLARERGWKIAIRSGGHSWTATFIRDGGMLLDLSRMNAFEVNRDALTATVQPGLRGTDLNRALRQHELFFPAGHCMSVGLGGFLLQGGFGWNSRVWGPACMSIRAIDIVTATGELVHASETENAELFWAARGAGPGFFGVVTKFDLALYPRPKVFMNSAYLYPIDVLDEVVVWARAVQPSLARVMEGLVFLRRDLFGHPGPGALVMGPVLADSKDEAIDALKALETCPVVKKALVRDVNVVTEYDELLQTGEDVFYHRQRRYAADNMWTNASGEALLPGMRKIAETIPNAPSHMMWMLWGPNDKRPNMAFSLEADLYIALYSIWENPAEDDKHQAWVTDRMRELEPLSAGVQVADENFAARSARYLADENHRRLEKLRAKHDPNGLFHSHMGPPINP